MNPANQLRIVILQPINRARTAPLNRGRQLDCVWWRTRNHNHVAVPNDIFDVALESAFDRCIFDKRLREISATAVIMLEMENWNRWLLAPQRSIVSFATNQANVATLFMQTRREMLRVKTGRRRVRPDILGQDVERRHRTCFSSRARADTIAMAFESARETFVVECDRLRDGSADWLPAKRPPVQSRSTTSSNSPPARPAADG